VLLGCCLLGASGVASLAINWPGEKGLFAKTTVAVLDSGPRLDPQLHAVKGCDGVLFAVTPVTNAEYYLAVLDKAVPPPVVPTDMELRIPNDGALPKEWRKAFTWQEGRFPRGHGEDAVAFVSMQEAVRYCKWRSQHSADYEFRIPLDDEWERMVGNVQNVVDPVSIVFKPDDWWQPKAIGGGQGVCTKDGFRIARMACEIVDMNRYIFNIKRSRELERRAEANDITPDGHSQFSEDGGAMLLDRSRLGAAFLSGMRFVLYEERAPANDCTPLPTTFRVVAVPKQKAVIVGDKFNGK
jgi:hypothetical protein